MSATNVGNDVTHFSDNHVESIGVTSTATYGLKINPTGYLSRVIVSGNTIDSGKIPVYVRRARSTSVEGFILLGNHLWIITS